MPNCAACCAELEPPVHTPPTVYVKTLHRIGRQGLLPTPHNQGCGRRRRHHRGQTRSRPAVALSRGALSTEYDRPSRY